MYKCFCHSMVPFYNNLVAIVVPFFGSLSKSYSVQYTR